MFGHLLASLDNPKVALGVVAALDDPALINRLKVASDAAGRSQADIMASTVRGFLDMATDEHWLQLVGIMNRAEDPGLAAIRAVLAKALPQADNA
jgi:hypothetical protein